MGGLFLGFYCSYMFEMCWKLVFTPLSSKVTIIQQGYQGRPMVAQVHCYEGRPVVAQPRGACGWDPTLFLWGLCPHIPLFLA